MSLAAALQVVGGGDAAAGPPYATDDPEPVELHHWELYLAAQTRRERDGWTGTAPHVEVNYGVAPNVQLHLIAPLAYHVPDGGRAACGFGDAELGVKIRLVQEGRFAPMLGTFPLVELPTGSRGRGLGEGAAQVFLPMWLQKSVGPWTTYGGWGVWIDTESAGRRWWFFGWQAQRKIGERLALGAEVFRETPRERGAESDTRFDLGAIVDVSDAQHLLVSAGRGVAGPISFQAYLAYMVTLGPR